MKKESPASTEQQQFYLDGFSRLIAGLKEDGDDAQMFEYLQRGLLENPDIVLPIIEGSIETAMEVLGQERRSGSSATLYYPIEAAVKYLAKQTGFFTNGRDPLTSASWSFAEVMTFLQKNAQKVIEIAGSKTTAKNLPQRAVQMMWLLDQVQQIAPGAPLTFIELGASNGLILDALKQPNAFKQWYKKQPSEKSSNQVPFGVNLSRVSYEGLGLDIAAPDMDWNLANILDAEIRREVQDFIATFPDRSNIVTANAQSIQTIPEVVQLVSTVPSTPIVLSCFMLYQVSQPTRDVLQQSVREFLRSQGGGFFLKTDIAKYMGSPTAVGGALSWVEDELGNIVSPRIVLRGKTISLWEVLPEDI